MTSKTGVYFFSVVVFLGFWVPLGQSQSTEEAARAILRKHCFACHGSARMSGLDLRQRESILVGGKRGPALVPGKAQDSLIYQAVSHLGPLKMPMRKETLSANDRAILGQWIDEGALWSATETIRKESSEQSWWSFRQPQRPPIPGTENASWVRNAIDAFILRKLEEKRLMPAPPADKRALIRRATYDLIGLPPTPDEIEDFLSDDSPAAFPEVVDRLLASPHYGERWGRHWLDLVRYADIPEAYRYRDWVVSALNRDMPYDRFILYQLAGDLIQPDDLKEINADGVVATGLLSIGSWDASEADKEKMIADIVDDQIDVVGRAFMGLTVRCARCHDHKYDPIPTEDYYSLAGIFYSTHILPAPGSKTHGSKRLRVPLVPKAVLDEISQLKEDVAETEGLLKATAEKEYREFAKGLIPETARYMVAASEYRSALAAGRELSLAAVAAKRQLREYALRQWVDFLDYRLFRTRVRDITVSRPPGEPGVHAWSLGPKSELEGHSTPWVAVNTNDVPVGILSVDKMGNATSNIIFPARSVALFPFSPNGVVIGWKSPVTGTVLVGARLSDADAVCGDGVEWVLEHRSARTSQDLTSGAFTDGGEQSVGQGDTEERLTAAVETGEMLWLVVKPRANPDCDTTIVEWTISQNKGKQVWNLAEDIVDDLHENLAGKGNPHADGFGNPDVWYFFDMEENLTLAKWNRTVQQVGSGKSSRNALEEAAREFQHPVERNGELHNLFISAHSPFWLNPRDDAKYLPAASRNKLFKLRKQLDELKRKRTPIIPYALAAQEGGIPQSAHEGIGDARIHIRGSYRDLGEEVPRHFLRCITGDDRKPITQGSGRLQLAQWLGSGNHPLTARVMVNRVWQHHFGEGIVRSSNNFGRTGALPSHPELLDFLATHFVDSDWSVKAMHRLIMLSATYQQSAAGSKANLLQDPDNYLLGRINRRRLESEALRDSVLAVSGTLDRTMGGPAYSDIANPRRTLYFSINRSDRGSFNPLFDAPDPSAMAEKRAVSTVAPQALFLLNHPFFLEQVRSLANRIAKEEIGVTEIQRIRKLYNLLYGRPPRSKETEAALKFLSEANRSKWGSDARAPETVAWEQYCHILLVTNEFTYVD